MKRAFTLIELLVVIAIIAILAAILFPVFAQAKAAAKKTASLSNIKQHGTSLFIYTTDTDDNMPNAMDGGFPDAPTPVSNFNVTDPTQIDMANSYWATAIQPYMKNYDLMQDASLPALKPSAAYTDALKKFTYSLNGFLHLMSSTSVVSPADATMFWMGVGKNRMYGYAHSYPILIGKTTGLASTPDKQASVRFQRNGADCAQAYVVSLGAAVETAFDNRAYGDQSLITYVDGHAKSVSVKSNKFPFTLKADGTLNSYYYDVADGAAGCYYFEVLSPLRQP